ncbi:Uncharacterized protein APZ42_028841 [Daphnia magna]|uniref:Uncharacterized protein n=1 Tax=Daphnia magna TaxID=35525 RepID=A0A164Q4X0_9CRUS|nr:Uncharacterized protein APZ42_028841 [Daphnia magna]
MMGFLKGKEKRERNDIGSQTMPRLFLLFLRLKRKEKKPSRSSGITPLPVPLPWNSTKKEKKKDKLFTRYLCGCRPTKTKCESKTKANERKSIANFLNGTKYYIIFFLQKKLKLVISSSPIVLLGLN